MNSELIVEKEYQDFLDEFSGISDMEIVEVGVLSNDYGDMFYSMDDMVAESFC